MRPHILITHKRRRLACLIAFVCAAALLYAAARYNVAFSYMTPSGVDYKGWFGYGVLRFAAEPSPGPPANRPPGWSCSRPVSYGFQLETPWRPYHTKGGGGEGVVIPLWYLPAIALGALLYTHGLVRGARWVTRGMCAHCGYDLAGLPKGPCPECGKDPTVAPMESVIQAVPRTP